MAMRDKLIFGGVNSEDFGVYVLDAKVNNGTVREYESISVAGRSGDLHIDKGRYSNIDVPYTCAITAEADSMLDGYVAALLAEGANCRLEDTIHPEYFRRGTFKGETEPRMDRHRTLAVFELKFDCAPQKWLVSGETPVAVSAARTIYNPTRYTARPLIRVTGTGSFGIGSETLTINSNAGNMVIDCESEDIYDSQTYENLNGDVTLSSGNFPKLSPGDTGITVNGVALTIVPRWWTL